MLENLGSNAHSNRILTEYYEIAKKYGTETADMVYDAYENAGRFTNGPSSLDKLDDLAKLKGGKIASKTGQYLDEASAPVAAGLQKLADKVPLGKGGATVSRMAGGRVGNILAKAVPVLGAVGAVADVGDILTNDTSMGNKVMDTAAMGVGGTIGGIVGLGNPFAIAGGASVGKLVSDGAQFLFGGGESAEERKLKEALALLQGGRV